MSRDYAAEMAEIVDAEIGDEPFVSAVIASHIVDKLRATDPDLLAGWLDFQAVGILRDAISTRERSTRSHARATRSRSVFGSAVERAEAGDATALGAFLDIRYVVDDQNPRVRLADMNRDQLLFAADDYERQENESRFEKLFLRALARKVGRRKVSDVYSEQQIANMWSGLADAA